MNLILQTIPSTIVSELIAISSFDGVVLDTEHGAFNNETLYACIQIARAYNKECFVRFTDLNKQLVRMCLDAGITGAIFSTIEHEKIGKEIVNFCRYPKYKGVRGCGLVRENNWGDKKLGINNPIIIGQIETKLGVENIHTIMECGFDMFITGPYDLSNSLGCVEEWDNELFLTYINKIYDNILPEKLGLFLPSFDIMLRYKQKSKITPKLLILGLDVSFIKSGIERTELILQKG